MIDLQHKTAGWVAGRILSGNEENEEKLLVTYGIEVVLNEFLKFVIGILIGCILSIFKEVLFVSVLLLVVRKSGGGKHCKTNMACMTITLLVLVVTPEFSRFLCGNLNSSVAVILGIILVELILVLIFVNNKFFLSLLLLVGCGIFMIINQYDYVYNIMIIFGVEIISCFDNCDFMCEENTLKSKNRHLKRKR